MGMEFTLHGEYSRLKGMFISVMASALKISISLSECHCKTFLFTTSMCIDSWGWSSFARCLIEINADDVLKDSLTMGIPLFDGLGFSKETVCIELLLLLSSDGFQTTVNKRKNGKSGSNVNSTNRSGKFRKQSVKPNVKYVPKAPGFQYGKHDGPHTSYIPVSNPYSVLDEESEEEVENVFNESVNLLSSKKSRVTTFSVAGDAT
ncbi:hypothetical protein Tco_0524943 [Tanacetum coccineum]